jgi:Fe-S cluster biogenesis protein NfuA
LVEQYRGLVKLVDPASVTPAVTSDPDDDQVLSMGKYQGIAIIMRQRACGGCASQPPERLGS